MTRRHAPRFALALLEWVLPDDPPLAGDLVEEFERRQSRAWFWTQVIAATVTAWRARSTEIRPLRLVEFQPADAVERTRRLSMRFRAVGPDASPLSGVGGLGLVFLGVHVTITGPGLWWMLLASILAGVALGGALIALHSRREPHS